MMRTQLFSAVLLFLSVFLPGSAAGSQAGPAPDTAPARVEAVKAGIIQHEMVVGRVEEVNRAKNSIDIVTEKKVKKTVTVSRRDMKRVRKGRSYRFELDDAGKVVSVEPVKQNAKQQDRQGK